MNMSQEGFDLIAVGLPTKPDLPVMRRFSGTLEFTAKLTKIVTEARNLMAGQSYKLEFEMTEPGIDGWLLRPTHVYPRASAQEKWKAIPLGAVVKFRAKLTGIGAWSPQTYGFMCAVLLTEAEPVEAK